MSMNVGPGSSGIKSEINVTPLVDVMLVLLIIMMLVAPLLNQGVSLKLPVAANTTEKPDTQDQTIVSIGPDKKVYIQSIEVQGGTFRSRIDAILENKAEKIVIIKADEDVEYSAVMDTMDQLRMAGIEDMGLITDPKQPSAGAVGGE
jgi:biopolymer transport protein TolR